MRRVAVYVSCVVFGAGCTGQLTIPKGSPGTGGSTVGLGSGGGGGSRRRRGAAAGTHLSAAIVYALQQCNGSPDCVSDSDSRPIFDAFQTADTVLSNLGTADTSEQYAILLVDDYPSCGSEDPSISCTAATNKLTQLTRDNVTTYVVTVGQDAEQIACLRTIALEGSSTMPYQGHNPGQLSSSLSQIVSGVAAAACVLYLQSAPADHNKVSVRVGNVSIPYDPIGREGWNYGNQQFSVIKVYGNSCRTIQNAKFKEIQVLSGCPP